MKASAARIGALRATQEWLVLEQDDQIIGFAYGQPLKCLAAFGGEAETGMSTSPITVPAEDASSTRNCCAGSPSGATDKPSPASPSNGIHRSTGLSGARSCRARPARMPGWPDDVLRRR